MKLCDIDVGFDFTSDSPHYWDHFWDEDDILGKGGSDPDSASPMLQQYHQLLWSRQLPNGDFMDLSAGVASRYLTWRDFRLGSDSIITSFRYKRYRAILEQVEKCVPDYREYMEHFLRSTYTIGGMIVFPKRIEGINPSRGCNCQIRDRWDLTLECIRRYYKGEASPLSDILLKDKSYFDLFVDFRGYVDFFFLQDCVSLDYQSVQFWHGCGDFDEDPLPQTADDYLHWMSCQKEFVKLRNQRITAAINGEDYAKINEE